MIETTEVLIIGGGPAGLSCAREAVLAGCETILIDDSHKLGGQLVKQTHKFFGSEMEYAGVRGIWITDKIIAEILEKPNFKYYLKTVASGWFEDGVVTAVCDNKINLKFRPHKLIIATGACEKMIPFVNNDLPGVYGAGAVQTLMNVYGVKPGKIGLMVGAGNIGLIVSYQLLQAGVGVSAVIEAADKVGGYWVHASKIARLGIPIMTRTTILEALGDESVEGAIIANVDENWKPIEGTERKIDCDFICLAVGLSPLVEMARLAGCEMVFVPELGGDVPIRNEENETSVPGIYIVGDAGGIEEASSAMIEGAITGLSVAHKLGKKIEDFEKRKSALIAELAHLRSGPVGEKIRCGLKRCLLEESR